MAGWASQPSSRQVMLPVCSPDDGYTDVCDILFTGLATRFPIACSSCASESVHTFRILIPGLATCYHGSATASYCIRNPTALSQNGNEFETLGTGAARGDPHVLAVGAGDDDGRQRVHGRGLRAVDTAVARRLAGLVDKSCMIIPHYGVLSAMIVSNVVLARPTS